MRGCRSLRQAVPTAVEATAGAIMGLSLIALVLIAFSDPIRPLATGLYLTFCGVVGGLLLAHVIVNCGPPACQYGPSTGPYAFAYLGLAAVGLAFVVIGVLRDRRLMQRALKGSSLASAKLTRRC